MIAEELGKSFAPELKDEPYNSIVVDQESIVADVTYQSGI
jgi:hypothetical protein